MGLAVEIDHAGLSIAGKTIVDDLSLTVGAGRFACIIGPSGWGRSTVLNMVSGMTPATSGLSARRWR